MALAAIVGIGTVSREAFAELYLELGTRAGLLHAPSLDPDDLLVRDGAVEHELEDLYVAYLALPADEREPHLMRVLRERAGSRPVPPLPRSWAEAAPMLMPRLRDGAYLDFVAFEAMRRLDDVMPVHRELVSGVYVTLVVDGAQTMTSVTASMLAVWGVEFDEAHDRALENLRAVSEGELLPLTPGLWVAPWEDAYAASRALLADELTEVCANPVVAFPNRDTLLIADGSSADALEALVATLHDVAANDGHPITNRIFRLQGSELQPHQISSKHRCSVLLHNLAVIERLKGYADQHAKLQRRVGEDCYVASVEADEAPDGRLVTRALWNAGMDTLLPRVHRVHLMQTQSEDGQPISSRIWVMAWEKLAALEGVLEQTDHFVPRFHACRFPTARERREHGSPLEADRRTAELDSGEWA